MNYLHIPWLELAIAWPLFGAAIVGRVRDAEAARRWSLLFAGLALGCAAGAWGDLLVSHVSLAHDPHNVLSDALGADFLVIDELSAPLVALVSLLYFLVVFATLRTKVRRFSFAWTLLAEALLLAMLSSKHAWGIVGLLIASTVPPLLELRARRKPLGVYVVHMLLFAALLIGGWWLVARQPAGTPLSFWTLLPLLIAIGVRSGMFPLHCWLTDLFEHATFGTALLTATPIAGAYAAVRLVLPVAPTEVLQGIGLLAIFTALYAAGMALVQREARRFFCFLFLSHSALIFVGLDSANVIALTGALCMWLSVSLALTGLGLTLRALEARHGRLSLTSFHGMYENTPALAICFLLTGLASVGFPGTFGFVGTEMLIDGALHTYPYLGAAVVAVAALNGIALLQAYFRLFTGARHPSPVPLGMGPRERWAVLALAALILGFGLWPQPGVASAHHAATELLATNGQHAAE